MLFSLLLFASYLIDSGCVPGPDAMLTQSFIQHLACLCTLQIDDHPLKGVTFKQGINFLVWKTLESIFRGSAFDEVISQASSNPGFYLSIDLSHFRWTKIYKAQVQLYFLQSRTTISLICVMAGWNFSTPSHPIGSLHMPFCLLRSGSDWARIIVRGI